MRLTGLVISAFLGAAIIPMVLYARVTGDGWPLLAHVAAFALAAAATSYDRPPLGTLRAWLPLALGPFLYIELRWLIEGVGRPHADLLVQGWERMLFASNPAVTWAPSLPMPWLSELLHFAYASYYLLVYVPPLVLYAREQRDEFAATMFALAVVYGVCFVTYLFFPVDGPRFLGGPAAAPDGPIRSFVLHLLAAASSRGTAFPSSHVAASVVASLCALRYQPRVGVPVALLTVGLGLGTVYGGFHYAVDALAGAVVGVAAWALATVVRRAVLRSPPLALREAVEVATSN
jgi:membrane-associated phospholipid phosphatase